MECPNCKTQQPDSATFCGSCGSRLPATASKIVVPPMGEDATVPQSPWVGPLRPARTIGPGPFFGLAGGIVMVVGSLLEWVRTSFGDTITAFDVPFAYLGNSSSTDGPKIGILLVLLGVAGAAVAFVPAIGWIRHILGGTVLIVVLLYVIQTGREVSEFNDFGSDVSITDFLGVGVYATALGALAMTAVPGVVKVATPSISPAHHPVGATQPGIYATSYPVAGPTNGFATASLVLGILGVWVLALIFGYVGKGQIDRSGGAQRGRGMAIAGITLGWIWAGLILLYFLRFSV